MPEEQSAGLALPAPTATLEEARRPAFNIKALLGNIFSGWLKPVAVNVIAGILVVVFLGNFALVQIANKVHDQSISPEGFAVMWSNLDSCNKALSFLLGNWIVSKIKTDDIVTMGITWLGVGSLLSFTSQILLLLGFGWLPGDPEIRAILSLSK